MAFDLFRIKRGLAIENGVDIIYGVADPSSGGGVAAPIGSLYCQTDDGDIYHKTGAGDTAWTKVADTTGSSTEDGFQNSYTGKPGTGSLLPQYTSNHQIADNDSLLAAISTLDMAIGADPTANVRTNFPILSSTGVNYNIGALDDAIGTDAQISGGATVTTSNSINSNLKALDDAIVAKNPRTLSGTNVDVSPAVALDSVAVATYSTVEWLLTIFENGTPANRSVYKVVALNDGATSLDYTSYAVLTVGTAIAGLTLDVDIDSGSMRLMVGATPNIDFKVQRIAQ